LANVPADRREDREFPVTAPRNLCADIDVQPTMSSAAGIRD
jgi:hypothetical protein